MVGCSGPWLARPGRSPALTAAGACLQSSNATGSSTAATAKTRLAFPGLDKVRFPGVRRGQVSRG